MKLMTDFQRLMFSMETTVANIAEGMAIFVESAERHDSDDECNFKLWEHFKEAYPESKSHSTGLDGHLVRGIHKTQRGHVARPPGELPRLVQLIRLHMSEASSQAAERGLAKDHLLLPSPLFIAIEAMTVPEEPHTRSFPLVAARALLSYRLKVWPRNAFLEGNSNDGHGEIIDENTVIREIGNCRTWVEIGDLWSIKSDAVKGFIGNFMAMRGVLLLRFSVVSAIHFLQTGLFSRQWMESARSSRLQFQFRLSQKYERLPPPADFMNEILGVPVALRGMENVFFNGIKPSVSAGLVIQLAGGPGSGKTTFALALAAALAPIGTQTIYFSFEEGAGDLVSKLRQQSQPRLNRLSYHTSSEDEWFKVLSVGPRSLEEVENNLVGPFADVINENLRANLDGGSERRVLPPLPFLVVLDSLSALALESLEGKALAPGIGPGRQRLARFVELCRKLRVLVVLITSDNSSWGDLDYLVDMVINLRVDGASEHDHKPVRLFSLSKSRHQISRHGTHIFHLSGDSGFRIAPQLSSQMDAQQDVRQLLFDRVHFIEAMNIRRTASGGYRYQPLISLHARSQLLIQGKGSSGKAGLALKIALSPKYTDQGFVAGQPGSKVLILSFLYPATYYNGLQARLQRGMQRESIVTKLRGFDTQAIDRYVKDLPPVDVIHLVPGVLHPEDLHSKMIRQLEAGRLSGRPYTSVIVDGMHNLALQFPGASDSSYLFPIMYGTLSRANVTTITTFTSLSLPGSSDLANAYTTEESEFRLKVHLPLLHTLVQASDYVLQVRSSDNLPAIEGRGGFAVRIQSSISRDPPIEMVGWRRQDLEFSEPGANFDSPQRQLPID
jgi:KaiC/GvpD/RAD55 family RecA-like ATPase